MVMFDVQSYLSGKGMVLTDIQPLSVGASGAEVYATKETIIKVVDCKQEDESSLLEIGNKEHNFYEKSSCLHFDHLPEVLFLSKADDRYSVFVFKRYQAIPIEKWNSEYQQMAADVCAKIHSVPMEKAEDLNLSYSSKRFSEQEINAALNGWKKVLRQTPAQDVSRLLHMAELIFPAESLRENMSRNFTHGDYFCNNLVWDSERKRMVVIDWQNYGIGYRGDLSFFMNIGTSWGMDVKGELIIDEYILRRSEYSNIFFDKQALHMEFAVHDFVTNFMYWWEYLIGAQPERVNGVYNRMTEAYEIIRETL